MEKGLTILCSLWDSIGHDPEFGQLQLFGEDTFVYAQEIIGMSIPTITLYMLRE